MTFWQFSKRSLLWLLCIVSLVVSTFGVVHRPEVLESWSGRSEGAPMNLGALPRVCRAIMDRERTVLIKLRVRAKSVDRIQNAFQSDALNFGVRVEISEGGVVGLVAQSYVSTPELVGVVALGKLRPSRVSIIEIEFREGRTMAISLDGSVPAEKPVLLAPRCDSVLIGAGFDESRVFDGTVTLTMEITRTDTRTYFGLPYEVRQSAQLLLALCLLALWRLREFERIGKVLSPTLHNE